MTYLDSNIKMFPIIFKSFTQTRLPSTGGDTPNRIAPISTLAQHWLNVRTFPYRNLHMPLKSYSGYYVLWRIDPFLSGDSVNSGRC
jgi:hypothetical protein